jgi:hypothetical protein
MRHTWTWVDRDVVHSTSIGSQEVRDVRRVGVDVCMTSTGDIEGNAAQLDCIEARDDRVRETARAIVATQDKASRNIWLYRAYVEPVR